MVVRRRTRYAAEGAQLESIFGTGSGGRTERENGGRGCESEFGGTDGSAQ